LFERRADNKDNWTFEKRGAAAPSSWTFDLRELELQQVAVQVVDTPGRLALKGVLDSLQTATAEGYGVGWKLSGSYNGAKVGGEGRAGQILSLQKGSAAFPLQGEVKVGETTISVKGSFTKLQEHASLDVRLKLAGNTMADLFPIIGVVLPETPPYHAEGRLIETVEGGHNTWRYQDFKGVVGKSDLNGTLQYQTRKPRSLLTGKVESMLLRFEDLGPLIGADTSDSKAKGARITTLKQPADKVLPVEPIRTKTWDAMDADVEFTGHKIIRNKNLPLDNITAHLTLKDRVLSFTPLNFGVAGGTLGNTIKLDGNGDQITATLTTTARHLKLKELFPGAESMNASFGELHGDASLSGQGSSPAGLLAHSNGEIKALIGKGTISKLLLETAGLNVANIVMAKLFGDKQIELDCLAGDFKVSNGLMQARTFRLETADAIVDITGQINLANERLDLDIKPENRTLRIFTLRSPLYVKGTFKHPDVGVQKVPLAARAGGAIVLGIIATPFAALLPLLNTGTNDSAGCASLLAAVNKTPKAPAAEKTKKTEPVHKSIDRTVKSAQPLHTEPEP
ncbi:MAG: AsmA family protein, partial [Burkholderiaceae bacterium]